MISRARQTAHVHVSSQHNTSRSFGRRFHGSAHQPWSYDNQTEDSIRTYLNMRCVAVHLLESCSSTLTLFAWLLHVSVCGVPAMFTSGLLHVFVHASGTGIAESQTCSQNNIMTQWFHDNTTSRALAPLDSLASTDSGYDVRWLHICFVGHFSFLRASCSPRSHLFLYVAFVNKSVILT